MNILIFEWKNFGIEDIKECFEKNGHHYRVITTQLIYDRVSAEFDSLFDKAAQEGQNGRPYDCVFTFNYNPVISNCCKRHNLPYIAFIYDCPHITLYSYTIVNPCNYVFIFDKSQYVDLKKEGINTVYYMPLAVNTDRLDRMLGVLNADFPAKSDKYRADISFVGSMYNEKHNLFDRFDCLSEYSRGYLNAIMDAQLKVYGYFFIEELLNDAVLKDMQKNVPLQPNRDGVETIQYMYANYFIARKLASLERGQIMQKLDQSLAKDFLINLYTPNPTPKLQGIHNRGAIDYYNDMPCIFRNSRINLNISLRSIRSGIPLRGMDILGAGGFLLSNYQADFYDFFTPGEDLVLYESQEDLLDKCRYYLKHESQRAQIAANGYGKVREFHNYNVRMKEIFEIVFGS